MQPQVGKKYKLSGLSADNPWNGVCVKVLHVNERFVDLQRCSDGVTGGLSLSRFDVFATPIQKTMINK